MAVVGVPIHDTTTPPMEVAGLEATTITISRTNTMITSHGAMKEAEAAAAVADTVASILLGLLTVEVGEVDLMISLVPSSMPIRTLVTRETLISSQLRWACYLAKKTSFKKKMWMRRMQSISIRSSMVAEVVVSSKLAQTTLALRLPCRP